MTIERQRVIQVGDNIVKIPLTKRKIKTGSTFEFRSSVLRELSIDGSPVNAGCQVAASKLYALSPDALGVDYKVTFFPDRSWLSAMDLFNEEAMKPRVIGMKVGVLKNNQITGTIPPTDRRIKTLFSYKPSK